MGSIAAMSYNLNRCYMLSSTLWAILYFLTNIFLPKTIKNLDRASYSRPKLGVFLGGHSVVRFLLYFVLPLFLQLFV